MRGLIAIAGIDASGKKGIFPSNYVSRVALFSGGTTYLVRDAGGRCVMRKPREGYLRFRRARRTRN